MRMRLRCGVLLLAGSTGLAHAQGPARVVPTQQTVVSGYGTVGYAAETQGENVNEFTAAIAPIFLFHFADRFLFEAELEFELEGGETETGLEYAQLDFLVNDNLTLVGGKFLVPFGVFGERLHPSWVNKFPTAPPIYGHHVTQFGAEPLLPILSDVGVMARGVVTPGRWNLVANAYATQGPAAEEGAPGEMAELHFPASSSDNNQGKMFGGRLDVVLPPWAEVNVSGFTAKYDDLDALDFRAWNVAAEARASGVEFRGEFVRTVTEIEDPSGLATVRRDGVYAQLAYRWRWLEPVVRWSQAFDTRENGTVAEEGAWQFAFGFSYWFGPSIALMAGYEINREDETEVDNDRIVAHMAFGF